ncbi:hypothetical protein A3G50_02575 [Candidatus Jorgensenbacteria bacterium RIFCSPLOWO2_12_FULL_42_11]|uniref:Uncharacterized protein n=1 Tax=Candidatus Jorgensenbacteria bacterium RIFCSPLOWO2_12_FULL_42_11 TaxID=1798473 RepID=A0A1F6C0R5_9BACT|nr:MAG: hypothetical protein A3G50_02575 [Candidatus Jorgensenbacteria bacterium RIFCSPLOWO2_12_FULL_42_11]
MVIGVVMYSPVSFVYFYFVLGRDKTAAFPAPDHPGKGEFVGFWPGLALAAQDKLDPVKFTRRYHFLVTVRKFPLPSYHQAAIKRIGEYLVTGAQANRPASLPSGLPGSHPPFVIGDIYDLPDRIRLCKQQIPHFSYKGESFFVNNKGYLFG